MAQHFLRDEIAKTERHAEPTAISAQAPAQEAGEPKSVSPK
jgi:hypothetical protein